MRWFDMVLATPIVGVFLKEQWRVAGHMPVAIGRVIGRLDQEGMELQWGQGSTTDHQIDASQGRYKLVVNGTRLNVSGEYVARVTREAGRLPNYSDEKPTPYSDALKECLRLSGILSEEVGKLGDVRTDRIGIVMQARVAQESAPPGIQRILRESTRVWSAVPIRAKMEILVPLDDSNDGKRFQCHHNIELDRSAVPAEIAVTLDLQYVLPDGPRLSSPEFRLLVETTAKRALDYFESVGDASALN